jgi:O-antigen ligase
VVASGFLIFANGFVDLALTIGIPGSALVTLWLIVLPLVDYYRAPDEPESAALKMLFLRICLFAAYESCFETQFTQVGAQWLILIAAAFGLRLLAVLRVSRWRATPHDALPSHPVHLPYDNRDFDELKPSVFGSRAGFESLVGGSTRGRAGRKR